MVVGWKPHDDIPIWMPSEYQRSFESDMTCYLRLWNLMSYLGTIMMQSMLYAKVYFTVKLVAVGGHGKVLKSLK